MAVDTTSLVVVMFSFVGAAVGAVLGAFFREWLQNRRLRTKQRQTRWLPLREAAYELEDRWNRLSERYARADDTSKSIEEDFCELYKVTSRTAIEHLETDDLQDLLDSSRNDPRAVQRVRRRMSHQLNYAASSMYITARYLAYSERALREIKEGRLVLGEADAKTVRVALSRVRAEMQGRSTEHPGAGVITEQQESIGESVWGSGDRVMSYYEFRKELLEPVGWEQFTGLFRFFVHFHKKLKTEVATTIDAVHDLQVVLERITR